MCNAARSALELHGRILASGTLLDPVAQPHELGFALVRLDPRRFFQIVHRGCADGTLYLAVAVKHRKQHHHPVEFVTAKAAACQCHLSCLLGDTPAFGSDVSIECETAALVPDVLRSGRRSYDFWRRRIDLCNPAQAIGLGIVRPGDKRSTHLCTVPAGDHAKPKRLFCLDVTRRKILHGVFAFRLAFDPRSSAGRFLAGSADNNLISSRRRAGQSPQIRPRPDRDDGYRPEPTPRRTNSRRGAPWRRPPARTPPEPTATGLRAPPADRADPWHCSRPPPERA